MKFNVISMRNRREVCHFRSLRELLLIISDMFIYEGDFLEMDERKQVEQVKEDVVEHYEKTEGGILPFGKTAHYIFKRRFGDEKEDILVFDINGNQITENLENYRRSAVGGKLSVSGKELRVNLGNV